MVSLGLTPGWHVNESQVRELLGDSCQDLKQLEKILCDEDIKDFGLPALADFSKANAYFSGPVVLQLSKFRNVSQPKTSDVSRDGIKKVVLTDGMSSISGLTFEDLKGLTSQTPPGTKILLKGQIPVEGGYLLLASKDITVIGGNVERLVERWLVEKSSFVGSVKSRKGEGAPKWVSFGAKSSKTAISTKGFKANDIIHSTVNKATVDEAFDKERQNRIESAVDGEFKKFSAPSTIVPPIATSKPTEIKRSTHAVSSDKGRDRVNRGRGRNKDPDEADADVGMFLKPAATTLLDFLPSAATAPRNSEPYVPAKSNAVPTPSERGNYAPRKHFNEHKTKFDAPQRTTTEKIIPSMRQSKPEKKQFTCNYSNSQSVSSTNAQNNGFPKDDRFNKRDRPRNHGRNNVQRYPQEHRSNYQPEPAFQPQDFPTVDEALVEKLSAMDLNLPGGKNVFYSRGNKVPTKQSGPNWTVGQTCQAPWSDGNYYLATIMKLSGSMCTVMSKLAGATARVVKGVGRIRPTALRAPITLTPEAVSRVQVLLQQQHDAKALKIGVKQKGCNGLTYTLDYANEKAKFDEEVVQDGITIWIDTKAQLSLLGTEMDYVSTKLNSEFVFRNPNIKGTCGCGESFSL